MYVAALRMDLHISQSASLKHRRSVVRHLVETSRHRFGVSAAEVDPHDLWQRAAIGFAAVASTPAHAEHLVEQAERFVWSHPEVEVLSSERGWVELD